MVRLCETAAANGKTVYFLGGTPGRLLVPQNG